LIKLAKLKKNNVAVALFISWSEEMAENGR
jgi:hypothetical protein